MTTPRARNSTRWLPPDVPWWRTWRLAFVALVCIGAIGFVAWAGASGGTNQGNGGTPWATLGTRDVHSLAFDPGNAQHLYFGHHTGLLESRDGGRSWQPTGLKGADAMNVRAEGGPGLQIAGHIVYAETADGGRTWAAVPNDLPGLDLHAFVIDPADPAHAWAYAVGFGLFESRDRGRHWQQRQPGEWPVLAVERVGGATTLLGVSAAGLQASIDGGVTWQALGSPDGQIASLTSAPDGSYLLAGTTRGLVRSLDGGRTWQRTVFAGTALTVAISPTDTRVVALVDDGTRYFRSEDGGATWPGPR